jgi:putative membrane protein
MHSHVTRVVFAIAASAAVAFSQDDQPSKSRSKSMGGDQQFMMKAAQGGMAEVQLGQLAQKNASNSAVKQFGERMVTDHSKANDQAKSLASQKNITLPTSMGSKEQSMYRSLSSKTGNEFDKAYITAMIKDHNEDIAEFQQEANSGNDPDVKAWAAKTLPTLKEHLRMAEDCAKQLGISTTTGGDR